MTKRLPGSAVHALDELRRGILALEDCFIWGYTLEGGKDELWVLKDEKGDEFMAGISLISVVRKLALEYDDG